jgi:hypothetical protein
VPDTPLAFVEQRLQHSRGQLRIDDLYDAISFAGKLNGLYKKSSINLNKVDPLFLPQVYSDSLGNVLTTDEKLKLIGNKVLVAHENARVFIKSYIEKKLSI